MSIAHNAPDELSAWFDTERITNQAEMLHMPESHESANPDCSAMLYKMFTENMKHEPCNDYEPKDDVSGYGADFNVVEPNFDNLKAVEMDASRFETVEMDASRFEAVEMDMSRLVVREPDSREKLEAGVVAILREAARNLSDYHDAGEALRRLTDTTNVYHALETLADMVERDYVRRESIEEVMNNDRALVDENSMLARELLKLRAELEKATNNLNSANKDFENARAELTAERDKLQEQLRIGWECECRLQAERERYREKFGKCLDYADAIHALMDEGMA